MPAVGVTRSRSLQDSLFPKRGDLRIRVAILDGPVDLEHPCFQGADLNVIADSDLNRRTTSRGNGRSRHAHRERDLWPGRQ